VLNEQHRRQTYTIGEQSFIELIEAAFMKVLEPVDSWHLFDPLAMAQIMTCLEPSKLARLYRPGEPPKWRGDRKLSGVVRTMFDHLISGDQPQESVQKAQKS
jgi:hypothetical protein